MSERPPKAHPGLAKASLRNLIRRRTVVLLAPEDGLIRDIIESADIVSEGLAREEAGSLVYYGSTSLLLPTQKLGGTLPEADMDLLADILARDAHLRLRALRIAKREAVSRAQGEFETMRAEISVTAAPTGIVVLIDVVANVQASALGGASR